MVEKKISMLDIREKEQTTLEHSFVKKKVVQSQIQKKNIPISPLPSSAFSSVEKVHK